MLFFTSSCNSVFAIAINFGDFQFVSLWTFEVLFVFKCSCNSAFAIAINVSNFQFANLWT